MSVCTKELTAAKENAIFFFFFFFFFLTTLQQQQRIVVSFFRTFRPFALHNRFHSGHTPTTSRFFVPAKKSSLNHGRRFQRVVAGLGVDTNKQ
jgi:hypothetical protein